MAPCAGRRITCCVTPSLPSNASRPNDISHSTGASPDNPHYILTKIHLRTANLWATHSKPNKLAPFGGHRSGSLQSNEDSVHRSLRAQPGAGAALQPNSPSYEPGP